MEYSLLSKKGVSVVGSRDVGDFEFTIARRIAQKLSRNNI